MFSIPNVQSTQTYPLPISEEIKNFNKTPHDVQDCMILTKKSTGSVLGGDAVTGVRTQTCFYEKKKKSFQFLHHIKRKNRKEIFHG